MPKSRPMRWNRSRDQVSLLFAMVGHRPVGVAKHFQMMCIHSKFCRLAQREVPTSVIWERINEMFDLEALDRLNRSSFTELDNRDFELPADEFGNLMAAITAKKIGGGHQRLSGDVEKANRHSVNASGNRRRRFESKEHTELADAEQTSKLGPSLRLARDATSHPYRFLMASSGGDNADADKANNDACKTTGKRLSGFRNTGVGCQRRNNRVRVGQQDRTMTVMRSHNVADKCDQQQTGHDRRHRRSDNSRSKRSTSRLQRPETLRGQREAESPLQTAYHKQRNHGNGSSL